MPSSRVLTRLMSVTPPNPIAVMNADNHNAYVTEANGFNAANPNLSQLNVAFTGDWVTAINSGLAQLNPYLSSEPPGQIDLWDSNPLLACCTTRLDITQVCTVTTSMLWWISKKDHRRESGNIVR